MPTNQCCGRGKILESIFQFFETNFVLTQPASHVWTAPFWQGVNLMLLQIGRVLSCVRPVDAAHMAAGPNAIRGIGSQSKPRA